MVMNAASWLERAILVVSAAASAGWFGLRVRKPLDTIRRSRPTPDFEVRPAGPRIRRFVWEVMAQARVIRERPLPGIAHAFVFWGFVAFAPVTLNHFASAFGLRFLDPASRAGAWYLGFVAVWAVAVAVAIAGLSVRRFVVRPRWLGTVSPESGFIALLIFLLMATYLGGLWIGDGSTAGGRACWWLHTAALLVFLPLIPHTKHLHLALGPIAVFLRRDGFSRIPPLSGDEDFGLDTGKDVTRIDALQAYACVECGRCTEHCPANRTGKALNPKEIVLGLRGYLNEFGPAAEAPLLGKHISAGRRVPVHHLRRLRVSMSGGGSALAADRRPAARRGEHRQVGRRPRRAAVPQPGAPRQRAGLRRERAPGSSSRRSGLPLYDGSQEYCLWLGCMGAYDPAGPRDRARPGARAPPRGRDVRRAAQGKVYRRSRPPPGQRPGGFAGGRSQHRDAARGQGGQDGVDLPALRAHHRHGLEGIRRGVRDRASQRAAGPAACAPARRAAGPREKAVFHDPCYLGRYRDVYDQPRRVVGRYAELIEPARTRERSFCCGAGGGQMFLGEEKGERVNAERARELAATGARTIATACPFCRTALRDALAEAPGPPPALLDIAQLAEKGVRPLF